MEQGLWCGSVEELSVVFGAVHLEQFGASVWCHAWRVLAGKRHRMWSCAGATFFHELAFSPLFLHLACACHLARFVVLICRRLHNR